MRRERYLTVQIRTTYFRRCPSAGHRWQAVAPFGARGLNSLTVIVPCSDLIWTNFWAAPGKPVIGFARFECGAQRLSTIPVSPWRYRGRS